MALLVYYSWYYDRVQEYVLRTLCAISPSLLAEELETQAAAARRDLESSLIKLRSGEELLTSYVDQVLSYVEATRHSPEANEALVKAYSARMLLVRLVATFFFSET